MTTSTSRSQMTNREYLESLGVTFYSASNPEPTPLLLASELRLLAAELRGGVIPLPTDLERLAAAVTRLS